MNINNNKNELQITFSKQEAISIINNITYQLLTDEEKMWYKNDIAFNSYGLYSYISFKIENNKNKKKPI